MTKDTEEEDDKEDGVCQNDVDTWDSVLEVSKNHLSPFESPRDRIEGRELEDFRVDKMSSRVDVSGACDTTKRCPIQEDNKHLRTRVNTKD